MKDNLDDRRLYIFKDITKELPQVKQLKIGLELIEEEVL